jgi:hypothetical protein
MGERSGAMRWAFDWLSYSQFDQPGWTERRDGYLAETAGDLPQAVEHFRRALAEKPDDPATARRLEWLEDLIRVASEPVTVPKDRLGSYAGSYGPRRLELEDEGLRYQRDGHEPYRLIAVDQTTFALEGMLDCRIEVATDDRGRGIKLIVHYINGSEESPRDPD